MQKYNHETLLFFMFPIINIGFNTLLTFFERGGTLAIIRALIVYSYVLYFLNRVNLKNTWPSLVLLFPFFFLVLVFFSSDITRSFTIYLKFISPFFILVIAMNVVSHIKDLRFIMNASVFVLLVYVFFTLLANLFGIGGNAYVDEGEEAFSTGLVSTHLYLPALAVVCLPFVIKRKRPIVATLIILLGLISFILLGISLRRTTLIIILFGIPTFYIFQEQYLKLIKVFFLGVTILMLTYPIYREPLMQRLEHRQRVFNNEYTLTSENRFIESGLVLDELRKSQKLIRVLLGREFLNSPGNYGGGIFGHRSIHGDFFRLLHGSGVVGLLLYLLFYRVLWMKFNSGIAQYEGSSKKELKGLFMAFFMLSILISLIGRFEGISFRTYLFLVMGSVIGVLQNQKSPEHESAVCL